MTQMDTPEVSQIRDCLTSGPSVYLLVILGYFWERTVIFVLLIKSIRFYIWLLLFHQPFLICRLVLNGPLRIVKYIFIRTTTTLFVVVGVFCAKSINSAKSQNLNPRSALTPYW